MTLAKTEDLKTAGTFFGGTQEVGSGKLVIQFGQKGFAEVATANWATETVQSRIDAILASYYADGTALDVVLCSNDSTALGVTNILEAAYTGEWPAITGQDCDVANVKNMTAGKQSMSIFKDTRTLARQVVKMVDSGYYTGRSSVIREFDRTGMGGILPPILFFGNKTGMEGKQSWRKSYWK